jgi:hypothetical protein
VLTHVWGQSGKEGVEMLRVVIVSCVLALGVAQVALGDVPSTISYQGVLRDAAGDPVPDGPYEFGFELYDSEAGGSALWTEAQILTVSEGVLNAQLGSAAPLDLAFDAPYWLEISVAGSPLTPRTPLETVPYAFRAAVAESLDASATYSDGDWVEAGGNVYRLTGYVGVGKSNPERALDVLGTVRATGLELPTGAGTGYILTSLDDTGSAAWSSLTGIDDGDWTEDPLYGNLYRVDGRIGIGTDNPTNYKLDIDSGSSSGVRVHHEAWSAGGTTARFERDGVPLGEGNAMVSLDLQHDAPDSSRFLSCGRGGWPFEFYINADGSVHSESGATFGGRLNVTNDGSLRAAVFRSSYPSSSTDVVRAEYNGTGSYDATAVYGRSAPAGGYGIGAEFEGGEFGVIGSVEAAGSYQHTGVEGSVVAQNASYRYCYGVHGEASYPPAGGAGLMFGVVGEAGGGDTNYGVFGWAGYGTTDYAGYFEGDVEVTGTISKAAGGFKIDHPLDPSGKYLSHSSVESAEMKNVYDGVVFLDGGGGAWVELPEWFEALNGDFRYQLTAIGEPAPNLYIAEKISGSRFRIAGGAPGMEVSWMVTGIRRDPVAEELRAPVETDKAPEHLGKYLHPGIYGQPASAGIHSLPGRDKLEGR